jgi:hypothetical protein
VGGQFATVDDGNPVWEDIEYEVENELEFEQMWRNDEKENGDREVMNVVDLEEAAYETYRLQAQVCGDSLD